MNYQQKEGGSNVKTAQNINTPLLNFMRLVVMISDYWTMFFVT
jgi:hypothetical protein